MESDGKRIRSSKDQIDIVEELIQALTAAGNYLDVLDSTIRREPVSAQNRLSETLEKGISQVERASDVARRLQRQSGGQRTGPSTGEATHRTGG